ncbi:MAG: EAL domain-containing protein [Pseudomonadota bacterium]
MGAQAVRLSNIDIDNALDNRDFEVLFQPIFDLGNGALARMETFVRWRHPKLGVLPPGAFISFFETQGRMGELTRYVLEEALDHYIGWRGNCAPGFSINLAATDLADEDFPAFVTALLRDRDFPADAVTFECPMPGVPSDVDEVKDHLARLKTTGVRLAIEVRGRANDFLREVSPFPFEEVKTGGAAILRFARTVRGPGLSAISELLDIANGAGASITAVGVEDQASLSALRGLGFSAAQGNHLGKVGGLSDFRPAQVNAVRELLELEALSSAQLSALFRTERPQIDEASATDTAAAGPKKTARTPRKGRPDQSTDAEKTAQATTRSEPVADTAPVTNTVTDNDAAPTNVVERARRKAAILARKKGKDALRAELAARRKKLGLAEPISTLEEPVSAARDLQDQLQDAFPREEIEENTKAGEENRPSTDILKEAPDERPEEKTAETETPQSSLFEKDAVATPAPPISAEETESPETSAETNEDNTVEALDVEMGETTAAPEETGPNSTTETRTSDPQEAETPDAAASEQTEQGKSESETEARASKNEPEREKPEISEQAEAETEDRTLTLVTLDDIVPAEAPPSASATGKAAIRRQEKSQPAEPSDETALVFVPADKAAPTTPAPTPLAATAKPPAPAPATAGGVFVRTPTTEVGAYFLDTIKVFTEIADAPVSPPEQIAIDATLPDTDNLVIVSMDDEAPATAPQPAQTTSEAAAPDIETPLFQPKQSEGPVMRPASETQSPETQSPVTGETPTLGTLDLDTDDIADDAATTLDPDFGSAQENERAHLSASRAIAEAVPARKRLKKNVLMRKYRLWPDHFWPRSWRRAWDRRADNREFVRRARLAAARLGSVEDDEDGELL